MGAKIAFLPQRPHLPIGTLRDAVTYPDPAGTFSDDRIREILRFLDLGALADRLDDSRHRQHYLSGGSQQRLALLRALLHEPDWIFLDEATSGLDEQSERRAYALLREKLPRAALVSIADRLDRSPSTSGTGGSALTMAGRFSKRRNVVSHGFVRGESKRWIASTTRTSRRFLAPHGRPRNSSARHARRWLTPSPPLTRPVGGRRGDRGGTRNRTAFRRPVPRRRRSPGAAQACRDRGPR